MFGDPSHCYALPGATSEHVWLHDLNSALIVIGMAIMAEKPISTKLGSYSVVSVPLLPIR